MMRHLLIVLAVLVFGSMPLFASTPPLGCDVQKNTWQATHIVVVEGGKVVESWTGDLKPGDPIPENVAGLAKIPPPPFDPARLVTGEEPPVVSGKRMVLFLAHVPEYGGDPKKLIWMGATAGGFLDRSESPATVAWLEGDRAYTVDGTYLRGRAAYALRKDGSIAGLKQRVAIGLAIRAQFEAAKADKDLEKRAERIVALIPIAEKYAGTWALGDCTVELANCGAAAIPIFVDWMSHSNPEYRDHAKWGLKELGVGPIDGVIKLLDGEIQCWRAFAREAKSELTLNDVLGGSPRPPSPNRLHLVLEAVRAMKLSAADQERVRKHTGLVELDRILRDLADTKQDESDMAKARETLRDILAGKFRHPE